MKATNTTRTPTTTTLGDIVVFSFCVLVIGFVAGKNFGEHIATNRIATRCEQQDGEGPLIAVDQKPAGVLCIFEQSPRPGYGKGLRIRKATRS